MDFHAILDFILFLIISISFSIHLCLFLITVLSRSEEVVKSWKTNPGRKWLLNGNKPVGLKVGNGDDNDYDSKMILNNYVFNFTFLFTHYVSVC